MGRSLSLFSLLGLALLLTATAAFAQGVNTQIKTQPLQNTDTFTIHISVHNTSPGGPGGLANPPWAGWAGAIMEIHNLDNTELDIDAIKPGIPMHVGALPAALADGRTSAVIPGPPPTGPTALVDPLGPRSQNLQSVARDLTFWHPSAPDSGLNIVGSQNQPLGTGFFHVKGSSPAGNSDVDATFRFWNIWHLRGDPAFNSQIVPLHVSDRVWVTSNITNVQQLHINTVGNPNNSTFRFQPGAPFAGHWLHITNTVPFHLSSANRSAFYATRLNTATLGVEHVPEPASAALIGLGLVSLAASRTIRRRRIALA